MSAGLAVVKYKLNLWDDVQDLFARAYDIQSTQLGQDNPELALTMSHSAGLLKAMNKDADAETVWRTVSHIEPRFSNPSCLLCRQMGDALLVFLSHAGFLRT